MDSMFAFITNNHRREMFNKWQAQKWWTENCEKVTELYNVQRLNRQAIPRSEDETAVEDDSATLLPHKSPSDTLEQQMVMAMMMQSQSRTISDSGTVSGTSKTEMTLSPMRTSPRQDIDRYEDISIINATRMDSEWVEQDEPGVYITIRALPHDRRELRRVRFSREKFGEMHAKVWWEENRARIHKQYL